MSQPSRLRSVILVPAAILGVGVTVAAYLIATRIQAHPEPPRERVWPVSATAIELGDQQPELSSFGEIVARRSIELKPLVAGRLVEVSDRLVDGARVGEGELLARIDPFEYETAITDAEAALSEAGARLTETRAELGVERSLLADAEKELVLRERDFERAKQLRGRGTVSEKARDDAELAVIATRQGIRLRRQNIARLEARLEQQEAQQQRAEATLARARRDLDDTYIVAPFDGYVADVEAALGKRVRDGDRLGRLIAAGTLEASFELSSRQAAGLLGEGESLVGRPVIVRWRVGGEEFAYSGRVARIGAEIDPTSGGIRLHAELDPVAPEDPLRAGAFVAVSVPDRVYRQVARVPAAAVSGDRIYVVEDGRLAERRVDVRRRVGNELIVSGDLREGELVVTTLFPEAGPGARVDVGR